MLLSIKGVCHRQGEQEILRDISFSVAMGERVVLLGINGCGKTTLLKLLNGLIFPQQGCIYYDGEALEDPRVSAGDFRWRFRSEVGLLFQNIDAMLFNPSVADEIAFGPRQLGLADVPARVALWAEKFDVTKFLERPPFELSGGEKKRVAMAAILAMSPKLLLLDEPTANLDPAWAARIVDLLAGLTNTTVIVSTHNLSLAEELGSRAILMSPTPGAILFDGPSATLVRDDELLVRGGLAHRHMHQHGSAAHAHYHVHDVM